MEITAFWDATASSVIKNSPAFWISMRKTFTRLHNVISQMMGILKLTCDAYKKNRYKNRTFIKMKKVISFLVLVIMTYSYG